MFEKDYRELMEEVKPDDVLVEQAVERYREMKRVFVVPKGLKVAAVIFCVLLVLAGGTVAVDAATDGAVRKFFGLSDSVAVGVDKIEYIQSEKKRGENSLMVGVFNEGGEVSVVVKSDKDIPVFFCYLGVKGDALSGANFHHFSLTAPLEFCETKEDIAWTVYWYLKRMVRNSDEHLSGRFIKELKKIKEEIGTGNEIKDGCALGVQFILDDLYAKEGKNMEVLRLKVQDTGDADGDGDCEELRGYAYVKVDTKAWEKESGETGKMQFEVEAMGGIPGTYLVTVNGYEYQNLYFDAVPIE